MRIKEIRHLLPVGFTASVDGACYLIARCDPYDHEAITKSKATPEVVIEVVDRLSESIKGDGMQRPEHGA